MKREGDSKVSGRQCAFSFALHSIRTRYSLLTAVFLLIALGFFYVGGRIVLVHLVRDAENQVREIGSDIARLSYRNADQARRLARKIAAEWPAAGAASERLAPSSLLDGRVTPAPSIVFMLDTVGSFTEGAVLGSSGEVELLKSCELQPYSGCIPEWSRNIATVGGATAVGLVRLHGRTHYVSIAHLPGEAGFVVVGTPFDSDAFSNQVNDAFSGLEVKVTNRRGDIVVTAHPPDSQARPSRIKREFGIVPLFSEAVNFYSGGFWELGNSPFEAVFTMRDIAGNAVSMIAISLPKTFSNVTTMALGRLTFFIAMVGILLILPIFWFQNQLLLNPLSKMIRMVKDVEKHHDDIDCPRVQWEGKDEFALLAMSVNSMLETLTRRTLAVAQSETRQKALIEGLPDAMVVFDRSAKALSIIKQMEDGIPVPGISEGKTPDVAVWSADNVSAFDLVLKAVIATGDVGRLHLVIAEKEDDRHFELRLSPMDGTFVLGVFRDVTAETVEHKRLLAVESRLANAQKQESLTQLAGGIAHDVNNILSVVNNTAEIFWLDDSSPEAKEALNTIRDAVKRGSSMTRELMAFAGETRMTFVRSDPARLIDGVRRLVGGIVGANVVLDFKVPEGLPAVDADGDQIWKVFFNLVKNSAEAMNGSGTVVVAAEPFAMTADIALDFISPRPLTPGKGVMFSVSDNGPGISPDMRRRIFDPYVSTKSSGRGFGLSTVMTIVGAHGGGVAVRSAVGHGSVFRIFLPESTLPVADGVMVDDEKGISPTIGNRDMVLIVDDDPSIVKTTSILLKVLERTAITANGRQDALDSYRRHSPRLACVLLDAHLGETDSVMLMSAFRTCDPTVPIIVTSGSVREQIDEIFASQPFDQFLAKPYTLEELKKVVGC